MLSRIDSCDGLIPCPGNPEKGQPGIELALTPASDMDIDIPNNIRVEFIPEQQQ